MPLPPTSGLGTQHIGESEKLTATANSWRAMKAAIGLAAGCDLTITLSALFECEYDSQIVIPIVICEYDSGQRCSARRCPEGPLL
jgi:hypothetical protein